MNRLHIIIIGFLLFPAFLHAQLPTGFVDERVSGPWDYIVGFDFDEAGGMYAWERGGKVYRMYDDIKASTPLVDISEEVGFFGDHGMLAMALHPNFLNNGYLYLLYAVDRHHLIHYGTASYDPTISLTHEASIGRLTRYTLNKADSFQTVIPNSRLVILGDELGDGIPLLHISHGVGDLLFGQDGSLLVSAGDGSTFKTEFVGGGEEGTYAAQALADGIIQAKEDVGSYRSQLLDSHSGKVLRIDPETGEGLASNPFFDPNAPSAPRSRVWALGFRNPFSMSLVPESGSHNIEDGRPGILHVGDVGSGGWEEWNTITGPGQNFGWPIYEGFDGHWGFWSKPTYNPDAPNPLYGQNGCEHPFFRFNDLLLNDTETVFPFWENPCNPNEEIPNNLARFIHKRPTFAYSNFLWNQPTRTKIGIFDSTGRARSANITEAPWNYDGVLFDGTCIINGFYYEGNSFPEAYQHRHYFADYIGWIKIADFDSLGNLVKIEDFHAGQGNLMHLDMHPVTGCIYYIRYKEKELRKICFGTDPAPLINVSVDRDHGPSPLEVNFDASQSKDPNGQPISFLWEFGDGQTSTDPAPSHIFTAENSQPQAFEVILTVTDSAGKSSRKEITISLNNTPPKVLITSIAEGDFYAVNGINILKLEAEVSDQEHAAHELRYEWQTFLLHNNHLHPEPIDTHRVSTTLLDPAGCDGEFYAYRVALTVYDGAGLSSHHEVSLWPNCDDFPTELIQFQGSFEQGKVTLDWESNWEKDISHFEIERAPDRLHFENLGRQASKGNEQTGATYQFIDNESYLGLNVYRLKILSTDGKYHYSNPIEVESYQGIGISLYPNPTANFLAIQIADLKETASIELFTLNGALALRESWEGTGNQFQQLSVAHLRAGMYYYRLKNGTELMSGKLLIVK